MVAGKKLKKEDLRKFADLLVGWSEREDSYFLGEFWKPIGISEMQFYQRVWRCQEYFIDFDYAEIRKKLRYHRFLRSRRKKYGIKERPCSILKLQEE